MWSYYQDKDTLKCIGQRCSGGNEVKRKGLAAFQNGLAAQMLNQRSKLYPPISLCTCPGMDSDGFKLHSDNDSGSDTLNVRCPLLIVTLRLHVWSAVDRKYGYLAGASVTRTRTCIHSDTCLRYGPDKEFNDRLEISQSQVEIITRFSKCPNQFLCRSRCSGMGETNPMRMATFYTLKGLFFDMDWAIHNAGSKVVVKLIRIDYLRQSFTRAEVVSLSA